MSDTGPVSLPSQMVQIGQYSIADSIAETRTRKKKGMTHI